MEKEEFESYINGSAIPPGSWQSSFLMCESIQVMMQNVDTIRELQKRLNKTKIEGLQLLDTMHHYHKEIQNNVDIVLALTSVNIREREKIEAESYSGFSTQSSGLPMIACNLLQDETDQ